MDVDSLSTFFSSGPLVSSIPFVCSLPKTLADIQQEQDAFWGRGKSKVA